MRGRASDTASVVLVPSRSDEWLARFGEVRTAVAALLPDAEVEHIGSTAVPGLPAKDVVDVLIGLTDGAQIATAAAILAAESWDLGSR